MPETTRELQRQMLVSAGGALVVLLAVVGLLVVGFEEKKADAERDSAVHASLDSAYTIVLRLDSMVVQQKASTDTILGAVRDHGRFGRDLQRQQAEQQRVLIQSLANTIRRELRAVGSGVDSVQSAMPAPRRRP